MKQFLAGMFLLLFYWQVCSGYNNHDTLTHASLDKVSVHIGEDVELRCIKVLKSMEYDQEEDEDMYTESAFCTQYDKNCGHQWIRNRMILKNNSKYEMVRKITIGYCENFDTTNSLISEVQSSSPVLRDLLSQNDDVYSYDTRYNIYCLNSILRIRNVQEADYGLYQCNFSSHGFHKYNDHNTQTGVDPVRTINLVKPHEYRDGFVKVVFNKAFFVTGDSSVYYQQCVINGHEVNWFLKYEPYGYSQRGYYSMAAPIRMDLTRRDNFWHCFNYTIKKNWARLGISESIIVLENICPIDNVYIYCSANSSISNVIKPVKINAGYRQYYRHGFDYDTMTITLGFILPGIFLLFLVAIIVALVRVKCCCNHMSRVTVIHAT